MTTTMATGGNDNDDGNGATGYDDDGDGATGDEVNDDGDGTMSNKDVAMARRATKLTMMEMTTTLAMDGNGDRDATARRGTRRWRRHDEQQRRR